MSICVHLWFPFFSSESLPKTTFGNCSNKLYLAAMSGGRLLIYCVLGGLLLIPGARAAAPDVSSSPYRDITDRNIFGLKPPPALPRPEDIKQPPPEIKPGRPDHPHLPWNHEMQSRIDFQEVPDDHCYALLQCRPTNPARIAPYHTGWSWSRRTI